MKKLTSVILIILLVVLLLPSHVMAASSASFSISGPATLVKGQVETYTVKVTVSDAAAASVRLVYDANFFELVDGNPRGVWDSANNVSTTATLTTVQLRCKAEPGSSGSLSVADLRAARLTGGIPPTESVPCSGMSKLVTNPAPTPTTTKGPTPTVTPKPTPRPTSPADPTPTVTPRPTATGTTGTAATTATTVPGNTTATTATAATPAATATATVPGSTAAGSTATTTPTTVTALPGTATAGTTMSSDPADSWAAVQSRLSAAPTGALVAAKLPNQPLLPASVLALLQTRNAKLNLDFGGYGYLIEANKLGQIPATLSGIDLSVSMAVDDQLTRAAGGHDLYQLHFAHDGELPGRFALTIKADKSAPGTTAYLYRFYAQAGVIACVQSTTVAADRTVTFDFYQCSDYFVSDKIIAGAMGGFSLTGQQTGPGTASGSGGPFSGGQLGLILIAVLCAILLTALGMMFVYRVGVFKPRQ